MARLLLVSTAEKGHLNPLVGVAQHLVRAGHHVGWLCMPMAVPGLSSLGVEPLSLPEGTPSPSLVKGGIGLANLVRDPSALRGWIQTLLLDAVPAQIEPLRSVLRSFRPDAVGTDPMLYQAIIAAHLERIPYACISSSLNPVTPDDWDCELVRTVRSLSSARRALFASYGLDPIFRVCDALSPELNTVFTTDAYVDSSELPAATHLVGPSRPMGERGDETRFPWERIDVSVPLVYCSFGSQISYQPEAFARVASAVSSLSAQLVISAGADLGASFGATLPGRVIAAEYVPQLELLGRTSVFISHGGANSVAEALTAGVPLLLSPVCNDQFLQARFLERAGAGLVLDLERASTEEIVGALRKLLEPRGAHREALARISASYRANDGARRTAELLAELAS
jgi:MGT family glycosyltransferase